MLPPDPKFLPNNKAPDSNHDQGPTTLSGHHIEVGEQAAPPAALSSAPSMTTLLHALRRAWKLALPLAIIAAIAAGVAAWMIVPPQYSSSTVFRIATRPAIGTLEDEGNFANVQKSQVAVLKSHDVLQEAVQRSKASELYGVHYQPAKLGKQLLINFNEGPEMMEVSLSGDNGEAVAALLTALGEVYPAKVNSGDAARIRSRIANLRRRLQMGAKGEGLTLSEQLRDKRVELNKAEKDAGLDDAKEVTAKYNAAQTMLAAAQTAFLQKKLQFFAHEADLAAKQARLKRAVEVTVSDTEVEEALRPDLEYQGLQKEMAGKANEISQARRTMVASTRERHIEKARSAMRDLEEKRQEILETARKRLTSLKKGQAREHLQRDVLDITDKIDQTRKQYTALEAEVRRWSVDVETYRLGGPKAPPEVEAFRDQVQQLQKEYTRVGDELVSLEGALPLTPRITRHTDAFTPTEKEYGRPLKYALASGVLVFGLVMLGMCFLEAGGRRVYDTDDIMHGIGMRVVGTLPLLPASARKKAAQAQSLGGNDGPFGMNEAVDAIRTVLLHAPRIDGARVVMVTSATGREGKTTVASHLAASLARAWRKTLLIDGDLRNPQQHVQFDQTLEPGLCEALRGEVEFDDVVKPTQIGRLWMMPAGKVDNHALQALAQEGVSAVFERLKEQYDFIVLDTSPVLPVPDALLLAKQADAVLMSVMKDHTRLRAVYQAHQRLETLGIRILGAVVIGEKVESYGIPAASNGAKK